MQIGITIYTIPPGRQASAMTNDPMEQVTPKGLSAQSSPVYTRLASTSFQGPIVTHAPKRVMCYEWLLELQLWNLCYAFLNGSPAPGHFSAFLF